jgi:hypothetical protein
MRNTYFFCMGTEHLRHQFNHLFDNIYEVDIKGFNTTQTSTRFTRFTREGLPSKPAQIDQSVHGGNCTIEFVVVLVQKSRNILCSCLCE